jgi:hypothetical protein
MGEPMKVYGFHCKTAGCEAFLVVDDLGEDTAQAVHLPINLGDDPLTFQCPDCQQAHEYYYGDHVVAKREP